MEGLRVDLWLTSQTFIISFRNAENQAHPLANHLIIMTFGLSARKSRSTQRRLVA